MNKIKAVVLSVGTVLLLAVVFLGPLRFLDNVFYDLNFAYAPSPAADSVVVVGIDVKSIDKVGAWPWPRSITGLLVKRIAAAGPRAVALDMLFPKGHEAAANDSLADAFAAVPNLVLPFRAGAVSSEPVSADIDISPDVYEKRFLLVRNADELDNAFFYHVSQFATLDSMFSRHADYGGFVNVSTSNTSQKLREAIHVMRAGDELYPSFAVASVAAYYGLDRDQMAVDGDGPAVVLGDRRVPLSSYAASAHINFRSDKQPVPVVSAVDVRRGKVDRSALAGKLVFVGITDAAAGADFFTTPATMASSFLSPGTITARPGNSSSTRAQFSPSQTPPPHRIHAPCRMSS
ncbi:MAG: CHASE2 domain-containing protein, partial [Chitinivibrionales bacterium]|nr:CHASE2 domain-containing protein [Chitinivibrionales bacterium]